MPFASSAFGQLRYIEETTPNTVPTVGNAVNLRMTSPTMKAAIQNVKSAEVSATRMSSGQTRVDMNIDGGFNFELSGREYDPFLSSVIGGNFVHYGTNGLGAVFSATTTASTITAAVAPTGASQFTNLAPGSWFKLVPPSGSTQAVRDYFADRWFRVATAAPTATVVTLDPSTPIAAPGIVTAIAGYAISQSLVAQGNVFRSYSMEYAMTDITQFMTFPGMRPNSLELNIETGSIITGSFGFLGGTGHSMQATTRLPGSPVASQSLEVMNAVTDIGAIYEAGVSVLGASTGFIKKVSLSVNNNLRAQKAVGVFGNADVAAGEFDVGGTLEMYVDNAVYYNKWLQGVTTSLAFGLADSAGNGYMIELDKVQFGDGGMGIGGRNDDTMLTLPFNAYFNAPTGRGIRITRAVAA